MKTSDLTGEISNQIYKALEDLGADASLLSIIGSWKDTLPDREILDMLVHYNKTGRIFDKVIAKRDDCDDE